MNKTEIAITKIIPNYGMTGNKKYIIQTSLSVYFIYKETTYDLEIKTCKIDGNEIKERIIEVINS